MSNKEIVFVSNDFGSGGAARVIGVLAEGFAKSGYKVTVYSYPGKSGGKYEPSETYRYIVLQPKGTGKVSKKLSRISVLRQALKKHPGATVISFEYFMNMQTIVAMLGRKNKIIISERNDPAKVGGYFPMRIFRNILYRFCNVLVCQTPDAKAYFPKSIRKKAVVIANPVKKALPEPWEGERAHEIVNFCRLEKQKNLPLLIDAYEEFQKTHSDYKLIIYGNGEEHDELDRYIKEKKLEESIVLHPAVSDIHERILKSAMFVSSSDYEGLSNSMLEAMAVGLPTICTDCPCGGARMVIDNGNNGILVPVGDKAMLAGAMAQVADDKDLARRLSHNGSQIRRTLDRNTIVEKWREIL